MWKYKIWDNIQVIASSSHQNLEVNKIFLFCFSASQYFPFKKKIS